MDAQTTSELVKRLEPLNAELWARLQPLGIHVNERFPGVMDYHIVNDLGRVLLLEIAERDNGMEAVLSHERAQERAREALHTYADNESITIRIHPEEKMNDLYKAIRAAQDTVPELKGPVLARNHTAYVIPRSGWIPNPLKALRVEHDPAPTNSVRVNGRRRLRGHEMRFAEDLARRVDATTLDLIFADGERNLNPGYQGAWNQTRESYKRNT